MKDKRLIGIASALPVEMELILKEMEGTETEYHAGMPFYRGSVRGLDVILAACGVSKVNASLFTQIMIDRYGPECIIFTGVAGSMDERVKRLDMVAAEALTFYDVSVKQLKNCFPYQDRFRCDPFLTELIREDDETGHFGLIITGDQFISDKETREGLKERFPEALAVEMEGAAVAQTSYINTVPFALIRCITDNADDDAESSYYELEQTAAYRSAGLLLRTLDRLKQKMR